MAYILLVMNDIESTICGWLQANDFQDCKLLSIQQNPHEIVGITEK